MRAAMIDLNTNIVVGVIMADATIDLAPIGTFLINVPDDLRVVDGWVYNPITQEFVDPNPLVGE